MSWKTFWRLLINWMLIIVLMCLDLSSNGCFFQSPGGLGVSSNRLLVLADFLASAVDVKATLGEVFGLEHGDGIYNDALELWFQSAKYGAAPENEIQKN